MRKIIVTQWMSLDGVVQAPIYANEDPSDGCGDLLCIGSSALVHALLALDLVDELRLTVDPLLLGGGKRALPEDGVRRPFRLIEGRLTSTGALLATYART